MVLKSIASFILSQISNPFLIVGLIIVSTILQQREKITGPLTTILDIPGQLTSGLTSGVEDIKGGASCLTNCSIFDFSCYINCFIPSAAAVEEEDITKIDESGPFPDIEELGESLKEVQQEEQDDIMIIPPPVTDVTITTMPGIETTVKAPYYSPQNLCDINCSQKNEGIGYIVDNKCKCSLEPDTFKYLGDLTSQTEIGGIGSLYRVPEFED
tara:strand:+ start:117 stop:755 length:639 start_codon:yes stop_codon:yes gene_type:complete